MSRLAMPVAAAEHSQPSPVSVSPSGRLADIPEASIENPLCIHTYTARSSMFYVNRPGLPGSRREDDGQPSALSAVRGDD